MKRIFLLLFLSWVTTFHLFGQETQIDSSAIKRQIGFADGKNFKPTKQIRKAYQKHILSNTSDYFNPTIQSVSNPNFAKDSIYVQSYKNAAYKNSVKKIKLNRKIITASIVIGLVLTPIVAAKGLNSFLSGTRFSN